MCHAFHHTVKFSCLVVLFFIERCLGADNTGVRYFKYYNIQPLKYWNKGLTVELNKNSEEAVEPKVIVELAGGEKKEIDTKGMKGKDILQAVVALDKDGEIVTLGPGFLGPSFHE